MVFQPAENDNDYSLVSGNKFPKGVTIVLKSVKEYIIIKKRNHLKVAFLFYLKTIPGGVVSRLKDGVVVSYRKIISSLNSPAVKIRFRSVDSKYGIKDQKIHFVQDK